MAALCKDVKVAALAKSTERLHINVSSLVSNGPKRVAGMDRWLAALHTLHEDVKAEEVRTLRNSHMTKRRLECTCVVAGARARESAPPQSRSTWLELLIAANHGHV